MNKHLKTLKKALEDPKIEGLDSISSDDTSRLTEIVDELPSDGCISEWRYGVGIIKYEYHIHKNGIFNPLKEAFEKGVRGGGPRRLTAVYCKEDLQKIIQSSR
jgi:hypothetical protein